MQEKTREELVRESIRFHGKCLTMPNNVLAGEKLIRHAQYWLAMTDLTQEDWKLTHYGEWSSNHMLSFRRKSFKNHPEFKESLK